MTPQEHYQEAERLLGVAKGLGEQAKAILEGSVVSHSDYAAMAQSLNVVVTQAQVHATLATVQQSGITYATEVTR